MRFRHVVRSDLDAIVSTALQLKPLQKKERWLNRIDEDVKKTWTLLPTTLCTVPCAGSNDRKETLIGDGSVYESIVL